MNFDINFSTLADPFTDQDVNKHTLICPEAKLEIIDMEMGTIWFGKLIHQFIFNEFDIESLCICCNEGGGEGGEDVDLDLENLTPEQDKVVEIITKAICALQL